LGARIVCKRAFELTTLRTVQSLVVSDKSAVDASLQFLDDHRILVDPACGAALAAIYKRAPVLECYQKVLVIVCGGAGVTVSNLETLARTLL
jgi:L-serine/L-threonine ammonia-lyase